MGRQAALPHCLGHRSVLTVTLGDSRCRQTKMEAYVRVNTKQNEAPAAENEVGEREALSTDTSAGPVAGPVKRGRRDRLCRWASCTTACLPLPLSA